MAADDEPAFTLVEAAGDQESPAVAGDGSGGYMIAWQDDRNGDWDIYSTTLQDERRVIAYEYDGLYRLTEASYSTGERFRYDYDPVGNREAMTVTTPLGGTEVTTYTYDAANRLTHVGGVALTWDNNGNLVEDHEGTEYAYDTANRLIRVVQDGVTYTFAYNGTGDRLSQSVGGAVTTYSLDLYGGLTQVLGDGDSHRPLSLNGYAYVEGNPVNRTDPTGRYWDASGGSNSNPRDLTSWLYREMKTNLTDPVVTSLQSKNSAGKGLMGGGAIVVAAGCRIDNAPVVLVGGVVFFGGALVHTKALLQFRDQVKNGARWDSKDEIGIQLGAGISFCAAGACDNNIEYTPCRGTSFLPILAGRPDSRESRFRLEQAGQKELIRLTTRTAQNMLGPIGE